jgi:hypothetical protein
MHDSACHVNDWIMGLPCGVQIPEHESNFFDVAGPVASQLEDARGVPRYYCRSYAALKTRATLPALKREERVARVCIKDVSRFGVSFLNDVQLFPSERVQLITLDGVLREFAVVRCRKIRDGCYEVGARLWHARFTQQ